MPDDVPEARWLPLREAAPLLGLERDTLRKQLARGERLGRRDNRGRWMVPVPASAGMAAGIESAVVPEASRSDAGTAGTSRADAGTIPDTRDAELAALQATVDGLHGQVTALQALAEAQRQHIADVRGELAEVKAERDRLLGLLDAERARVDQLLAVPAKRPRRWLWLRRGSGPFRGGAGMSPSPRDRQDLWYWAAVAGVILVLLVIAWATGWFGDVAPPESAPVIPRATTQ